MFTHFGTQPTSGLGRYILENNPLTWPWFPTPGEVTFSVFSFLYAACLSLFYLHHFAVTSIYIPLILLLWLQVLPLSLRVACAAAVVLFQLLIMTVWSAWLFAVNVRRSYLEFKPLNSVRWFSGTSSLFIFVSPFMFIVSVLQVVLLDEAATLLSPSVARLALQTTVAAVAGTLFGWLLCPAVRLVFRMPQRHDGTFPLFRAPCFSLGCWAEFAVSAVRSLSSLLGTVTHHLNP